MTINTNILGSSDFNVRTHNGYVTVTNSKTADHRTFQIKTVKSETAPDYMKGKRVIALFTGTDRSNFKHWTRFGFVYANNGVKLWSRFRDSDVFAKYANILNHVEKGVAYGLDYEVEGHCRVCNRLLTNPLSIKTGIGPICGGHGNSKAKLKEVMAEEVKETQKVEDTPSPSLLSVEVEAHPSHLAAVINDLLLEMTCTKDPIVQS